MAIFQIKHFGHKIQNSCIFCCDHSQHEYFTKMSVYNFVQISLTITTFQNFQSMTYFTHIREAECQYFNMPKTPTGLHFLKKYIFGTTGHFQHIIHVFRLQKRDIAKYGIRLFRHTLFRHRIIRHGNFATGNICHRNFCHKFLLRKIRHNNSEMWQKIRMGNLTLIQFSSTF